MLTLAEIDAEMQALRQDRSAAARRRRSELSILRARAVTGLPVEDRPVREPLPVATDCPHYLGAGVVEATCCRDGRGVSCAERGVIFERFCNRTCGHYPRDNPEETP